MRDEFDNETLEEKHDKYHNYVKQYHENVAVSLQCIIFNLNNL